MIFNNRLELRKSQSAGIDGPRVFAVLHAANVVLVFPGFCLAFASFASRVSTLVCVRGGVNSPGRRAGHHMNSHLRAHASGCVTLGVNIIRNNSFLLPLV